MEYKELLKHHTQLIKDQNQNKWEVIEASDLKEICEAYHQDKLKLLGIGGVSESSLSQTFKEALEEIAETLDSEEMNVDSREFKLWEIANTALKHA